MNLSPLGSEQARALATYLQSVPFNAIYASPMRRVQQTLQQIVQHQTQHPVILDDLREVDFGAWTGFGWEEVQTRFGVSAYDWLDHLEHDAIAEAEPIDRFRRRVEQALHKLLAHEPGQTVAVVCHGGVIRMVLSQLLGLPLRKMAGFDFEYASLTIVDYLPAKVEVQLLNFTPWRDAR
jgi:broad specificity phosphatase PhoE